MVITDRVFKLRKDKPRRDRYFFNHGLGDALMLRSILPAIPRPIVLACPEGRKYDEVFRGFDHVKVELADSAGSQFDHTRFHAEDCCLPVEGGRPIKPRIALEHDFGVVDYTYRIRPSKLDLSASTRPGVQATIEKGESLSPYVVLSLHGASSPDRKDCPLPMAEQIAEEVLALGMQPILLNYANDRQYQMPDRVISTHGWPMEAACLWNLLAGAHAFIGIDSGPLHLALTVPELPCMFIRNKIDFMRFFYDSGLDQIREILPVNSTTQQTKEKVRKLCSEEQ